MNDWDWNPTITTIESTSVPITELQFPSITVCPDEKKPPDRWAFVEKYLNRYKFTCTTKDCEKTVNIKALFLPVIRKVLSVIDNSVQGTSATIQ